MNDKAIYSSGLFGEYSPYYTTVNGKVKIFETMKEALNNLNQDNLHLEVSSVLSLLNFNYILGDKTLIKNISRIPWHSDLLE